MKSKIIIATLLLTLVAGISYALLGSAEPVTAFKPKLGPVTVIYHTTDKITGKTSNIEVRLQKADGDWQSIDRHIDKDGNILDEHTKFAVTGRGVFLVSEQSKELMFRGERPVGGRPVFSESAVKASPQYIGETEIAGHRAIKLKLSDTVEKWISPDYSGLMLRYEDAGMIKQAVSVSRGLIVPVAEMPNYKVNYDGVDREADALESIGEKKRADEVRKQKKQ